jgi:hypothetical protein
MDELKLYPAWRQALQDMIEQKMLAPGSLITREWLTDRFGIKKPHTIAEYQKSELEFLRQFSDLREALLEDHSVMLRPNLGMGYEVIPPSRQTARAVNDRMRAIGREVRKLGAELSFIRVNELSDDERSANSDAQAKLGTLTQLLGRKRSLNAIENNKESS